MNFNATKLGIRNDIRKNYLIIKTIRLSISMVCLRERDQQ